MAEEIQEHKTTANGQAAPVKTMPEYRDLFEGCKAVVKAYFGDGDWISAAHKCAAALGEPLP